MRLEGDSSLSSLTAASIEKSKKKSIADKKSTDPMMSTVRCAKCMFAPGLRGGAEASERIKVEGSKQVSASTGSRLVEAARHLI